MITEFENKVKLYIESKFQAKVLLFEKSNNLDFKYYVRFQYKLGSWFQPFQKQFEIDFIDFQNKTIGAIIYSNSNFDL